MVHASPSWVSDRLLLNVKVGRLLVLDRLDNGLLHHLDLDLRLLVLDHRLLVLDRLHRRLLVLDRLRGIRLRRGGSRLHGNLDRARLERLRAIRIRLGGSHHRRL